LGRDPAGLSGPDGMSTPGAALKAARPRAVAALRRFSGDLETAEDPRGGYPVRIATRARPARTP
ncbi:MAG: hypothetical protein AAFQ16_11295, partial [Pseudomonadota bacterium]